LNALRLLSFFIVTEPFSNASAAANLHQSNLRYWGASPFIEPADALVPFCHSQLAGRAVLPKPHAGDGLSPLD
jgi:hypothetical protein